MSEWNGKLITDMDTGHIENTMRLLITQAKKACKKVHGSDFKLYLNSAYYDLQAEFEKRDLHF